MLDLNGIRGSAAPCSDARTASEEIMLDEGDWEAVRRLHKEGWSISAIARHMNLDRKTIRTWLRRGQWAPLRRGSTGGHAAGVAWGVSAAAGAGGAVLGPHPVSGTDAPAWFHRQLRYGQAL